MLAEHFLKFGFAFLAAAILTPVVRWVALKEGWIAKPSADRWHKQPTALMGGIAIFAAIAMPVAFFSDFKSIFLQMFRSNGFGEVPSIGATICLGATFLFGVGLFDDLRNVKPHNKLIAQILAASLVVFLGFRLNWFPSLTLDTLATLFWIVGITNAFNLLDNMDGLCAGVGLVSAAALGALYRTEMLEPFWVALVLSGAMAGFLIYNFKPAKIFMGDCGSLVIGFSISVLTLCFTNNTITTSLARIAVPILLLLVPIMDTTLVTFIRLLSGRKASTGGRDHTSHRLVLMGFSEKKAVLFLYGVGGVSGLAAVYVSRCDSLTSPSAIVPVVIAIVLMGVYLSQLRVYPEKEFSALRGRSFTPILMELTYKRQLILVLLDFCLVAFSYYFAYRLRFEDTDFIYYFKIFLRSLPAVIACKMTVFFWMGVYRGIWGFLSTNDVYLYIRASFVGTIMSVAAVTFLFRFNEFSKAVFIIDWLLMTCLLLGVRGSFRLLHEIQRRNTLSGEKVIIYGAGRGGELLLREILHNKQVKVRPIGFVDDDPLKKGKKLQGYPIIGAFDEIDKIRQQYQINGILISFNNASGESRTAHAMAAEFCKQQGLSLKQFKIDLQEVAEP
jgi:UDP-GlcNAc:undecaprenyl-phosphate GlcNAc-1-phosphate transferase